MFPRRAQPDNRAGFAPPAPPVAVLMDPAFRRAMTNDAYAPAAQAYTAHQQAQTSSRPPPQTYPYPPQATNTLASPSAPSPGRVSPNSAASLRPHSPPRQRPPPPSAMSVAASDVDAARMYAARPSTSAVPAPTPTPAPAPASAPAPVPVPVPPPTPPHSEGDTARAARRRARAAKPRPPRAASGWVPASMHPEVSGRGPESGSVPGLAAADELHPALAGLGGVRARSIRRAHQQATPAGPSLGRRSTLRKQLTSDDWTPPETEKVPPQVEEKRSTPVRRLTLAEMDDANFSPDLDDPDALKAALGRTLSMRGNATMDVVDAMPEAIEVREMRRSGSFRHQKKGRSMPESRENEPPLPSPSGAPVTPQGPTQQREQLPSQPRRRDASYPPVTDAAYADMAMPTTALSQRSDYSAIFDAYAQDPPASGSRPSPTATRLETDEAQERLIEALGTGSDNSPTHVAQRQRVQQQSPPTDALRTPRAREAVLVPASSIPAVLPRPSSTKDATSEETSPPSTPSSPSVRSIPSSTSTPSIRSHVSTPSTHSHTSASAYGFPPLTSTAYSRPEQRHTQPYANQSPTIATRPLPTVASAPRPSYQPQANGPRPVHGTSTPRPQAQQPVTFTPRPSTQQNAPLSPASRPPALPSARSTSSVPVRPQSPVPVRSQSPAPVHSQFPAPVRSQSPAPIHAQSQAPTRAQSPAPVRPYPAPRASMPPPSAQAQAPNQAQPPVPAQQAGSMPRSSSQPLIQLQPRPAPAPQPQPPQPQSQPRPAPPSQPSHEKRSFTSWFGKRDEDEKSKGTKVLGALFGKKKEVAPPKKRAVAKIQRFPINMERAIYRLSHYKLADPRRPLAEQVCITNLMFWYLALVNKKFALHRAEGAKPTRPTVEEEGVYAPKKLARIDWKINPEQPQRGQLRIVKPLAHTRPSYRAEHTERLDPHPHSYSRGEHRGGHPWAAPRGQGHHTNFSASGVASGVANMPRAVGQAMLRHSAPMS